ncbi:hypothetical protein PRIC1_003994 [Phytophthora ramorum]
MIVPTRFGLKFAPIPTLALEYEDDLKGVVDATGESATSLYVYRDGGTLPPARKLHVVELPMLTRSSETQQITRQLQQDNERFLAPGVVNEAQLKRLLDRLVESLPETEQRAPSLTGSREVASAQNQEDESESELEESLMEGSAMEESVAEASRSDEHETPQVATTVEVDPNRGAFVTHEAESDGNEDEAGADTGVTANTLDSREESQDEGIPATTAEKTEESEAEEDARKTRALRSESDVSEEDIQSEELEYFSEDGSDEDSF